jgi:hypothetical protein
VINTSWVYPAPAPGANPLPLRMIGASSSTTFAGAGVRGSSTAFRLIDSPEPVLVVPVELAVEVLREDEEIERFFILNPLDVGEGAVPLAGFGGRLDPERLMLNTAVGRVVPCAGEGAELGTPRGVIRDRRLEVGSGALLRRFSIGG